MSMILGLVFSFKDTTNLLFILQGLTSYFFFYKITGFITLKKNKTFNHFLFNYECW